MSTIVLWLDANARTVTSFGDQLLKYRWVEIFTEPNLCIDYIKTHPIQTLFLVASGSLAEHVVPEIYECANVKQILIFCASIVSHMHWTSEYVEKLLMYDHPSDLLARLWTEMEEHFRKQADEYIQQAEQLKEEAKQYKQSSCG